VQGMETADQGKRCAIYEEVQKIIMEDAMVKPLHLWARIWGVRSGVEGLSIADSDPGWFYAFDIYLKK